MRRTEGVAPVLFVAVLLSVVSAAIHFGVAPEHFDEWWLFGVLFIVAGVLQLAWAALVLRRGADQAILIAGAVLNLGIAGVWVWSRTAGLPIGPEAGEPEAVGVLDVASTVDELLIAAIALAAAWGGIRRSGWLEAAGLLVASASALAMLTGLGH